MGTAFLPPGFRFHPTDEELIGYYLHRKVHGLEIELEIIPVIDLYKFDPWELPDKSFIPNRDMEWFFFCPRDRKYPNGARANRATKAGYWKATGKDRKIVCQSSVAGCRKTLVFYRGRAPLGDRTDWIMYEYRLSDDLKSQGSSNSQGAFALCRVVKKNEQGHKTYDSLGESTSRNLVGSSSNGDFSTSITSNNSSRYSTPSASPYPVQPVTEFDHPSSEIGPSSLIVPPDLILDSSKDYTQAHETSRHFPQNEYLNTWHQQELREFSTSTISYSNFNGEIESVDELSRFNYMSPYSEYENYMGFYGLDDMPYQGQGH